jgi:dolichol-phosphate mannosyltransferase
LTPDRAEPAPLSALLVAPAYNEEGRIGRVVRAVPLGVVAEVLVVDDCSSDGTRSEAEAAGAKVISHEVRRGVGAAIRTGIDFARSQGHDVVVVIAGNGKDDPREIPTLLKPIREKGYDYVQGSRYLEGGISGRMPFHRRLGTRLYPFIFRILTGFPCTDATNGFRAYRVKIFDDPRIDIWQEWLDTYELEYYIHYKVIKLGYRVIEVPVKKVYPQNVPYARYTKARPFTDWWKMLRPIFYLTLKIKS